MSFNRLMAFEDWMRRRGLGEAVRARLRRLNPGGPPEGCRPRGWNPAPTFLGYAIEGDFYSKRRFIRLFGRKAFEDLEPEHKVRYGKRQYVTGRGARLTTARLG